MLRSYSGSSAPLCLRNAWAIIICPARIMQPHPASLATVVLVVLMFELVVWSVISAL
jgi:hypothetical protein